MGLLSLEHGKTAYRADFALYGAVVLALAAWLLLRSDPLWIGETAGWVLLGLASWTLIEYGLHRFVLHHVPPFRRWHADHHQRPQALIGLPTVMSAGLFAALVFAPAWWAAGTLRAASLMLGVLAGYFVYTVMHHASHHWRTRSAWLQRRKRWHALHHHHADQPVCFGVTSAFWDHAFGTRCRVAALRSAEDAHATR